MRITTKMMQANFLQNMDRNRMYLEMIHNRIASGSMVNRPSDNPAAATRIMNIRSSMAEMTQHQANMRDAQSWLEISEGAFNGLTGALQRARLLTVQAAGGTLDSVQMGAIQVEIDEMIDQLIQVANQTHGSNHVFGGTNATDPPFARYGQRIFFRGDFHERLFEVAPGVNIQVNVSNPFGLTNRVEIEYPPGSGTYIDSRMEFPPGSGLFYYEYESDIFGALTDLSNLMADVDVAGLSSHLERMDEVINFVLSERASLGARSNRMATAIERNRDALIEFTATLQGIEATDYAREMTNFAVQQAAFQATVMSGAQVMQPTLLDFLR